MINSVIIILITAPLFFLLLTKDKRPPIGASESRLVSRSGCGWWAGVNTTSELEISAGSGSSPCRLFPECRIMCREPGNRNHLNSGSFP